MKTFKIYPLILVLAVHCHSRNRTEIGPGLLGQELWDIAYINYEKTSTLGHNNARATFYSIIDVHNEIDSLASGLMKEKSDGSF